VPTASVITYGQTLGSSSLSGGLASTAGSFAFTAPTIVPAAGAASYSVTFTPTDTTDYTTMTTSVSVTTKQASSTLTGPATQPVLVAYTVAGTIPVAIAGQYSGPGITGPSGSIGYTILNSSNTPVANGSLTIGPGGVTVPVANLLVPGNYNVNMTYNGDMNYTAAAGITVTLQVGKIQPLATITSPTGPLVYGTTLGITATASYNNAPVAGTFAYTAMTAGGTAFAVTPSTVLPAGTYTLTASFAPTDTVTYKTASATALLAVNKAAPSISVTSSVNPILVQNATSLTATVSSAVSGPAGTVTFYDNTASSVLASNIPLTGSVATLSISTLAVGTHSITAIYSGDTNFVTLTSAAFNEQVDDFSLSLSSGSVIAQTILPGGTATYLLTISPTGAATFPAAVTLSVSGLPTGAIYTINPSMIAAGAGATSVTLTITVPKQTVALNTGKKLLAVAFALLLLPYARRMRRRARKLSQWVSLLLLIAGVTGTASLTGCGSPTGFFAQSPQTYNVMITSTSGALTRSASVE